MWLHYYRKRSNEFAMNKAVSLEQLAARRRVVAVSGDAGQNPAWRDGAGAADLPGPEPAGAVAAYAPGRGHPGAADDGSLREGGGMETHFLPNEPIFSQVGKGALLGRKAPSAGDHTWGMNPQASPAFPQVWGNLPQVSGTSAGGWNSSFETWGERGARDPGRPLLGAERNASGLEAGSGCEVLKEVRQFHTQFGLTSEVSLDTHFSPRACNDKASTWSRATFVEVCRRWGVDACK